MAVTRWPSFSKANLTDWAPVQILLDAIRERACVLHCVQQPSRKGSATITMDIVPRAMRRDVPKTSVLEGIRSAICSLAGFYIDPNNESWHNAGCKSDVASFGADAPIRVGGAHSLAVLPDVASCEADPQALAAYRTFLANAAWWLDAFRYVDASERATFATKLAMSEYNPRERFSDIEVQLDNPTVTTPEDGYPLRTINRWGYPQRLLFACEERLSFTAETNDSHPPSSSSGHLPHDDDWQAGTREDYFYGTATCYEGLSVANPSPLDANVVLLPCSDNQYRTVNRCITGPITFVDYGFYDFVSGHFRLQSYVSSQRREEWFGDGLKPEEEMRSEVEAIGDVTLSLSPTRYVDTSTVYHNSPDGTIAESETSTNSGEGSMQNMCKYPGASYSEVLRAFDNFNAISAQMGVPFATRSVAAARSTVDIEAWDPNGRIPVAFGWYRRPTDSDELHTPGPQRRHFDFTLFADLGFAVLFDFRPYFQFGGY